MIQGLVGSPAHKCSLLMQAKILDINISIPRCSSVWMGYKCFTRNDDDVTLLFIPLATRT